MLTAVLIFCCFLFSRTISQITPLRFDQAIHRLHQYVKISPEDLMKYVEYNLTPEKMSEYMSLSIPNNKSSVCERDFKIVLEAATKIEYWAIKVLDAWGKPLPSGVVTGNFYWLGNYHECIQPMYYPANKSYMLQPFDTQHCTVTPKPAPTSANSVPSIVLGVCVPSSCDREDVLSLVHKFFPKTNMTVNNVACSGDPPNGQKGLTHGAIATIIILSILGFLVLLGTIVDVILASRLDGVGNMTANINDSDYVADGGTTEPVSINLPPRSRYSLEALVNTTPSTVFLAEFSALKTLRRIFTIKQKNDNESYPFINGIRVLSLFWVIIGHSFLFSLLYASNPLDFITWTRNVAIQFISSAEFSVDTFFVLSGFLTTILFVRQVEKEKKLSSRFMVMYYIHRYIRLTPTFLLVVAISINLTPYFGNGPVYPTQQGFEVPQCRSKYWWTSIVYLGNIIKSDYLCLTVSWYLHNDMQFHWIAPLCLIPFVMNRKPLAFVISILLTLVGIGSIAGLLIYYPDLQATNSMAAAGATGRTFFNTIYVAPWCRISAYFIGVLTGFFVVNTGREYRMNKYILILFSILASLFVLICIFAIYPDNILVPGIDRTSFILYQSLSRTLWSLAIGWLFFLCMTNRGGIMNKILSWPIWIPLARLNYATYLIHLTVIYIVVTNQRMPFYYQLHLVINNFVSHIFFSYITAILVVIFIETPFFIIEKKLFKR